MASFNRLGCTTVLAFAAFGLLALPSTARCQQANQQNNQQTSQTSGSDASSQSGQNPPANAKPSSASKGSPQGKAAQNPADDNPFPMEQSQAAASGGKGASSSSQSSAQPSSGTGKASGPDGAGSKSNTAGQNKQSPAKDNPFPEDQSAAAAKASGSQNSNSSAGQNASSSSSSDSGYSSSDANLPPPDLGQGTLGHHEKMDSFSRDQTQDGHVKDDLNVADFYMKNGNYRGAFLRYDDALEFDPQNDEALYGKAMAMCKQNMTNDAMAQFKSYAKENPQGKYALKAEKMLAHPNKCMHNF